MLSYIFYKKFSLQIVFLLVNLKIKFIKEKNLNKPCLYFTNHHSQSIFHRSSSHTRQIYFSTLSSWYFTFCIFQLIGGSIFSLAELEGDKIYSNLDKYKKSITPVYCI